MTIREEVRTAVLRRLRQLGGADRRIVMLAAVVGRDFDLAVVAAGASHAPSRVRAAFERAAHLQLIVAGAGERYSFRHALTREIVYAEALDALLRPLHRRVTRALEERARCGSFSLQELAYHAWASGDRERALHYNELAGDDAAAMHAAEDALRYYGRARSLLDVEAPSYARLTQKLDAAKRLRVGGD